MMMCPFIQSRILLGSDVQPSFVDILKLHTLQWSNLMSFSRCQRVWRDRLLSGLNETTWFQSARGRKMISTCRIWMIQKASWSSLYCKINAYGLILFRKFQNTLNTFYTLENDIMLFYSIPATFSVNHWIYQYRFLWHINSN